MKKIFFLLSLVALLPACKGVNRLIDGNQSSDMKSEAEPSSNKFQSSNDPHQRRLVFYSDRYRFNENPDVYPGPPNTTEITGDAPEGKRFLAVEGVNGYFGLSFWRDRDLSEYREGNLNFYVRIKNAASSNQIWISVHSFPLDLDRTIALGPQNGFSPKRTDWQAISVPLVSTVRSIGAVSGPFFISGTDPFDFDFVYWDKKETKGSHRSRSCRTAPLP